MRRLQRSLLVLCVPALVACSKGSTIGEACDARTAGPTTFVDQSQRWGLSADRLGVVGNRIVAGDVDGDGYPDLIVQGIYTNKREQVGVPPKWVWLLLNRPGADGGRTFVDATVESGLFQVRGGDGTELRSAQLAALGDVDNDGDLDVFSGTYVDANRPETDTGDRSELLLNDGSGHFTLAPQSAPSDWGGELFATTGASFVDADRDGRLDLFVGFFYRRYGATDEGFQAQLYRGQGDGSFGVATAEAGLLTEGTLDDLMHPRPAYGVTACDLDDDGAAELMISAYGRQPNLQYLNDGRGHFTEVGQASHYAADDNLDYTDNWMFKCTCAAGRVDDPKCPSPPVTSAVCDATFSNAWSVGYDDQPFRLAGNTFSTLCADLDGDGKQDLYSTEIHHWWAGESSDSAQLLRNASSVGALSFVRVPNADSGLQLPHKGSGWDEGAIHVAPADFDNDGLLDLVVGMTDYPNQFGQLFRQGADHRFTEIGEQVGLHHACVSGLAVADFDRDGDLDVVVGSATARDCGKIWKTNEVHLYESSAADGARFLEIKLRGDGTTSNGAGIGARVTVRAGGQAMVREIGGGYGHMGMQNDTVAHVGLGACDGAAAIEVRWPDAAGTVETWEHVAGQRLIELRQGQREPTTVVDRRATP